MMKEPPKDSYRVIGLMSGSSLDGLDIAYCSFHKISDSKWDFDLIESATLKLGDWQAKLSNAIYLSESSLASLSKEFAQFMAEGVRQFVLSHPDVRPELLASHGHTIYHYPDKGVTCQIGDGQVLADALNLPVVSNLRQGDMDFGGQGAPIVPIGDQLLFADFAFCLNIGGIANVSVKSKDSLIAFDIAVANQVLNKLAMRAGRPFDEDGLIARSGRFNNALVAALDELDYFKLSPPKSLDNSYTLQVMEIINQYELSVQDLLASYVEHLVRQIKQSIDKCSLELRLPENDVQRMLVTGGGAHNGFLIERLQEALSIALVIPSEEIVDFKEAIVMGLIGVLRSRDEVNVLASVTGASRDTSSGEVFFPK